MFFDVFQYLIIILYVNIRLFELFIYQILINNVNKLLIMEETMDPLNSFSMYVLVGTSSTGKTSIMNQLAKQKENLRIDGVDFRRNPSEPTPENMERDMIDEAIYDVAHGKNVIFDLADAHVLHSQLKEKDYKDDVKVILVYCPFDEMCRRMEERSKGDQQENRIGTVPLDQFAEMYGPVKSDQQPLEEISREHAEEMYKKYFDMGVEHARKSGQQLPPNEIIMQDREKFAANFLSKLGFTDSIDKLGIGPKDPQLYTAIVNSQENTSEKIASLINRNEIFKI